MNSSFKKYKIWKRFIDILLASVGMLLFTIPLLFIAIIIKITSKGPIIHWSNRTGINNSIFRMAKLRTMRCDTPVLDSNLFKNPGKNFVRFGKFLRKFGIDELPQLYNIFRGDMSIVGPRPVILKDKELISERAKRGVNTIKPGLTGLAQINGRNELSIERKVYYDEIYLQNVNFLLDVKIIFSTNYYLLSENIFKRKENDKTGEKKNPLA